MFDALPSLHQRARGDLTLRFKRRGEASVLADLRQDGCLKARFPRCGARIEVVTLNSSGGVAGGDWLRSTIHLEGGTAATIAGQAAERFYRALPHDPPAQVRTEATLESGSLLEWLPQEAILFDRCALDRRLSVDMAADAGFLGVEALVFGRAAMGERVREARLSDTIAIRRDGHLILHDAIRLYGAVAATMAQAAVAGGQAASATIVYVAPDAAARLDAVRAALADAPAECGASTWRDMLVVRMLARDGAFLRAAIVAGLAPLRDGRPLPRVWML